MSITKTTTLHCDNCGEWVQGSWHTKTRELRLSAKKAGWTYLGGKDYCPGSTCRAAAVSAASERVFAVGRNEGRTGGDPE